MTAVSPRLGAGAVAGAGLVALAVLTGALMSLQTRINGGLAVDQASAWFAAAWSFGSGFLVISAIAFLLPGVRSGLLGFLRAVRERRLPVWLLFGGSVGAYFVLCQGFVAVPLGVAIFTMASIAGGSVGALAMDSWGFAGLPKRPITWPRVVGSVLVLVAIAVAGWDEFQTSADWWLLLLPLIAGVTRGLQQAINGSIRAEAGSGIAATWVNFAGGSLILVTAGLVALFVTGQPVQPISSPWVLLGGMVGLVHIFLQSYGVRRLGVLVLGFGMTAGQLVAAALLDLWAPLPGTGFDWWQLAGAVLAFVATLIAALRPRSSAPSSSPSR